jgi:hypothetical protein
LGPQARTEAKVSFFLRRRSGVKMVRFFVSRAFLVTFWAQKVTKPQPKHWFSLSTLSSCLYSVILLILMI